MQHQTGWFTGANNSRLFFQCWLPDNAPEAVVFIAHGIVEHSGRYSGLGEFLASQSLAVYAFDYRYHGRSEGMKGRMDKFSLILEDFSLFLGVIQKAQPGRKIFMLGHSMGTSLSLAFAVNSPSGLSGLILSGSPLRSRPTIPTALIGCLYLLVLITPNLGLYLLDSSTLSRDPAVVAAYDSDPLVFRGKLSCSLIISFMWMLHRVESRLADIQTPVLIMHGSRDNLCSPEGSQVILKKIGSKDKTLITYPGFYHEILNEPEKDQVRRDIVDWLRQQR